MSAERLDRVHEIFGAAVERGPAEREAFQMKPYDGDSGRSKRGQESGRRGER
jgi:hypothetical protein